MRKIILLALAVAFALTPLALAKSVKEKPKAKVVSQEISGEIDSIDKNTITLTYYTDLKAGNSYGMTFSLNKDVKLEHLKSLAELKVGDTVYVQYDDVTDDTGRTTSKAKLIGFIRAAPAPTPQTTALDSATMPQPEEPAAGE